MPGPPSVIRILTSYRENPPPSLTASHISLSGSVPRTGDIRGIRALLLQDARRMVAGKALAITRTRWMIALEPYV